MAIINKKIGIIFVLFTTNNVLYVLTNCIGEVLFSISSGTQRIKGLKKIVPATVHLAALQLAHYISKTGFTQLHLKIKGVNKTKKIVVKTLSQLNLKFFTLEDTTSFPHNGCRKKKKRRI
uniref:Ribosomal protein S11 n=1 Tax=Sirodotia delicatula TaxID=386631 RepID=A0A343UY51_9FLOR|nr:ribosomal protein S11 [Sirodotia delicatula]AVK39608.1 ribosomal protein S11 [Sirodotia delicatula]